MSSLAAVRRLAVLGSTGSIGTSALDVVAALPDRFRIAGLMANTKWQELAAQCQQFLPRVAILTDRMAFEAADRTLFPRETDLQFGQEAVCRLASASDVDVVLSAVVGAAGLEGTWAALEAGKRVALANKETLVVGGSLILELARRCQAEIIPVDSEHSAIFQAMAGHSAAMVERIVLTASGGPFRGRTSAELERVTVEEALKHPTWQMGPKITIDSATMMNKALEIVEAKWLFGLNEHQISVIVHPDSVIHSFVEFVDGSVLAQLSPPDMRLPIQYAFTYPERLSGCAKRIRWNELVQLKFEEPDSETFPSLKLGYEVAKRGGTAGAVLNAANEAAVSRFLSNQIRFLDVARCCRAVLEHHDFEPQPTLERLWQLDAWARQEVGRWIPS